MKPQSFFVPLVREYRRSGNEQYADIMKHYMRDQFEYLGIKTPQRRKILQEFIKTRGLPKHSAIDEYIKYLWARKHREYAYTAIEIMRRMIEQMDSNDMDIAEYMIINRSWWDTVDSIASGIIGTILLKDRRLMKHKAEEYNKSSNMWLRRTSIIFQLSYKEKTDTKILIRNIKNCSHEKEFFIQKAIGWSLRQYARIDPKMVKSFVNSYELSALSRREAIKHID